MNQSTVIELADVKQIAVSGESLQKNRQTIIDETKSVSFNEWGRVIPGTTSEIHIFDDVHQKADMYHKNYLEYLFACWAYHRKVVLAPDHIWFTVSRELGSYVRKNADACRALFTTEKEGKKELTVDQTDHPFGGIEEYRIHMVRLFQELEKVVPVDAGIFVPRFSTTDDAARWAFIAAFADAVSPYYDYFVLACGFPAIKVLGTASDWIHLENQVKAVSELFKKVGQAPIVKWLSHKVVPVVGHIQESLVTKDAVFWNKILTPTRCGGGSEREMFGWFTDLFIEQPQGVRKIENFPSHVAKIGYRYLRETTGEAAKFSASYGLFDAHEDKDGFLIPEFHHVTNAIKGSGSILGKDIS